MILNTQQIEQALADGAIKISPFDPLKVEAASIDLKVGPQGATTSKKKIINLESEGFMVLEPGDSGVLLTEEVIELDAKHVARFGLRSKYARKGILATTGLQIDPGFRGRLCIGITNLTPKAITLPYLDDIISVEFHELAHETSRPYSGPYQGKIKLDPSDIDHIISADGFHFAEVLTTLQALSQNVGGLSTEMKSLRWLLLGAIAFLSVLFVIAQVVATVIAAK